MDSRIGNGNYAALFDEDGRRIGNMLLIQRIIRPIIGTSIWGRVTLFGDDPDLWERHCMTTLALRGLLELGIPNLNLDHLQATDIVGVEVIGEDGRKYLQPQMDFEVGLL